MKTVSVVMATYNGEKFLSEQIDSILAQSYPIHELIVQDDCSVDGTTDIVRRYMAKHSFIKLFVNERNVGYNENFRRAAMHATGDFVALSDQDDIWFPQKLERQVAAIGHSAICFSNTLDGKTPESIAPSPDRPYTLETIVWRNQVPGHTMLCRRDFVQNPHHWLGYILYDWSLLLHALISDSVVKIAEPLNFHRRLENSVTNVRLRAVTWQSYVYGWSAYRIWQNHPSHRRLHAYLYDLTLDTPHKTANRMLRLMLRHDIVALLQLSLLCMKHRHATYPIPKRGIMGVLRGFFMPHLTAYQWLRAKKYNKQRKEIWASQQHHNMNK